MFWVVAQEKSRNSFQCLDGHVRLFTKEDSAFEELEKLKDMSGVSDDETSLENLDCGLAVYEIVPISITRVDRADS